MNSNGLGTASESIHRRARLGGSRAAGTIHLPGSFRMKDGKARFKGKLRRLSIGILASIKIGLDPIVMLILVNFNWKVWRSIRGAVACRLLRFS